ncbi:MAG: hypothetical protein SD837_03925 [Candidatus Electrothrix scaldis]|nr:MAG: hypothetical protein SD837_03925 [Candidatus Electrothrix sp. GW3-3]
MLDWVMKNKEWLFSGVVVAVIGAVIGWLRSKRGAGESGVGSNNRAGRDQTITIDNSVHQTHSGSGDNVAGDKIIKG